MSGFMKVCPRCNACMDDTADSCPLEGSILEQPFKGTNLIDDKYYLERRLGRGGMGTVYLAKHQGLGRHFALKLINAHSTNSKNVKARFNFEAKALGKLKHPNIVDVTDYGIDPRDDGLPFLVMEHLVGQTLRKRLRIAPPLSFAETLRILEQVADGIDWAHKQGILHCDLKPENIFLCESNGRRSVAVKILDFGLTRLFPLTIPRRTETNATPIRAGIGLPSDFSTLTLDKLPQSEAPMRSALPPEFSGVHEAGGTPAYMAPEVISGTDPRPPSDLYSFGIVAYELLVGRIPFVGSPEDMLRAHVFDPPPKPSELRKEIGAEIEDAILRPLEKDPAKRPSTAREIVRAIRSAGSRAERREWRAREIPRRTITALVIALIMAASWLVLLRTDPVSSLERRSLDALLSVSASGLPDPRILLITIDEDSLQENKIPIADKADEIAGMLEHVFASKAAAVAIDFLLPYSWSSSQAFSRLVLAHANRLTLAALGSTSETMPGTECISGLTAVALGPERTRSLFGLVNLQEDGDGVVRLARLSHPDILGADWETWAAKAARSLAALPQPIKHNAGLGNEFLIDYAIDWRQFERISWKDLKQRLNGDPTLFENRLVLVGGDFFAGSDDYHRVPVRRGFPRAVSGVVLQALIINTVLSGMPIREANTISVLAISTFICALVLFGALYIQNIPAAAGFAAAILSINVILAFLSFRWFKLFLPLYGPIAMGLLALGIGLLLRRKLTPILSHGEEKQ